MAACWKQAQSSASHRAGLPCLPGWPLGKTWPGKKLGWMSWHRAQSASPLPCWGREPLTAHARAPAGAHAPGKSTDCGRPWCSAGSPRQGAADCLTSSLTKGSTVSNMLLFSPTAFTTWGAARGAAGGAAGRNGLSHKGLASMHLEGWAARSEGTVGRRALHQMGGLTGMGGGGAGHTGTNALLSSSGSRGTEQTRQIGIERWIDAGGPAGCALALHTSQGHSRHSRQSLARPP